MEGGAELARYTRHRATDTDMMSGSLRLPDAPSVMPCCALLAAQSDSIEFRIIDSSAFSFLVRIGSVDVCLMLNF